MAIAAAVVGERRSKVLVRDQGVLKAASELLLKKSYPSKKDPSSEDTQMKQAKMMMDSLADECDSTLVSQLLDKGHTVDAVGVAALALMSACIDGVGGESYAHFLSSDTSSLTAILSTLPTSTETTQADTDKTVRLGKIRQFALTSSLFRDLCLIETCREAIFKHTIHPVEASSKASTEASFRFFPQTEAELKKQKKQEDKKKKLDEVKSPDPVASLATSLQLTSPSTLSDSKCRDELVDARECAVAALANLALHVAMRARFTPALMPLLEVAIHVKAGTSVTKKSKGAKKQPQVNMCETPAASAFALAALMNALITEDKMKIVLCENQGVSKLLQLLKHICGSAYGVIRVRVAGLLGRLVSVPSTIEELRKDVNVSIMSDSINNNCTEYIKNKEKVSHTSFSCSLCRHFIISLLHVLIRGSIVIPVGVR